MRALNQKELLVVAGGTGAAASSNSAARSAALKQCEGLPANTKVTFTIQISANVSGKVSNIGGESTTTQTVEIETTCGDLRKAT